ncbi:hypothetical protein P3L51_07045 [Streptomyces sp. PSRA5]|uniref:hypothetical protein n=1 Tax=Streptomyces panacea TaxID=3035064 RepID=UPI00339BA77C
MLTYEDIINAPVAKLRAAADRWSEMTRSAKTPGSLFQLAQDAQDMKTAADKAAWQGVNAGVTKEFIAKTAREFTDAAAEAKGVMQILEDGYAAIKKARDDLLNIRDHEGPAAGIHVDAKGKVTARNSIQELTPYQRAHEPDYAAILQQENKNVAAWQAKIDRIVDNCDDTDVAFKNALEANVTDRKDFSGPTYTTLDQEEAARAAALAGKGRDLTHTELQALNALLKDNSKSVEFSKNFYEKLGPEKSLAFFGQLSTDTSNFGGEVDKQRLKDVQELQRNLGLNLANASHDSKFTAEWGPELRKAGTERIPLYKGDYNGAFGYQLLGGIMRSGNYDPKFLNPMAEHVAQLHQKDPTLFSSRGAGTFTNPFNPSGVNGAGYDPMTAMLEALGNSPDAAKQFFTDPPTAYNEDGTVKGGATADLGKTDGTAIGNYLDFFGNEKWEGFPDTNEHNAGDDSKARNHMPDALGRALEAATLGYPAGHPDGDVVRDADNAAIMRQVMEKYGSDPELLKEQEALADSLGTMGAGYINDINWALAGTGPGSVFSGGPTEGRIDFDNAPGGDGESTVRDFLSAVGQHPDAYATLSTAEQVYTRSVLEAQVGQDGTVDEGGARTAIRVGSEVQGMLDQTRADQVIADNLDSHEEFEKAVAKRAGSIEFATAVGAGAAVAFLPAAPAVGAAAVLIPLASDVGPPLVEGTVSQIVGAISEKSVDENEDKVKELNEDERRTIYASGEGRAMAPMDEFLARNEINPEGKFGADLIESQLAGYQKGNSRAKQQGHDPDTG